MQERSTMKQNDQTDDFEEVPDYYEESEGSVFGNRRQKEDNQINDITGVSEAEVEQYVEETAEEKSRVNEVKIIQEEETVHDREPETLIYRNFDGEDYDYEVGDEEEFDHFFDTRTLDLTLLDKAIAEVIEEDDLTYTASEPVEDGPSRIVPGGEFADYYEGDDLEDEPAESEDDDFEDEPAESDEDDFGEPVESEDDDFEDEPVESDDDDFEDEDFEDASGDDLSEGSEGDDFEDDPAESEDDDFEDEPVESDEDDFEDEDFEDAFGDDLSEGSKDEDFEDEPAESGGDESAEGDFDSGSAQAPGRYAQGRLYADEEPDDDYEDEPEGAGFIWKLMIGLGAVAVVIILAVIGVVLHSKGMLFGKGRTDQQITEEQPPVVMDEPAETVTDNLPAEETDQGALNDEVTDNPAEDEEKPAEEDEEKDKEYEEVNYEKKVDIGFETVSVLKDLKLKLINKGTGKLIANVPLEVKVVYPDGTENIWKDGDGDGIIYYNNLAAGTYKLSAIEMTDEKYADYKIPDARTAEVVGELAYKAVDIADEIKESSEVDENAEDTARDGADSGGQSEVVTAEVVTDTLPFVESTKTDTYVEADRSSIDYKEITAPGDGLGESNTDLYGPEPYKSGLDVPEPATDLETGNGDNTTEGAGESTGDGSTGADRDNSGNGGDGNTDSSGDTSGDTAGENTVPEVSITLDTDSSQIGAGSVIEVKANIVGTTPGNLTVTSSDDSIATAMLNGDGIIVISGVSAGRATIRISVLDRSDVSATVDVEVTGSVTDGEGEGSGTSQTVDPKSKLKFSDGTQVYVSENGNYREALYEDYTVFTQFFRLVSTYTGWQKIDENTYYYTSDGKPATGEQIIQGVKYVFDENGKLKSSGQADAGAGIEKNTLGIDVSKWNGEINWKSVRNAGITYAIIRVGYRGSTKGSLIKDSRFRSNIEGAQAAGIKVGVYFFSQATNEVEAVEEASMVIEELKGYSLSLPVFLDVEASGGRGDKIDVSTRTAVCRTFCETIRNAGYSAGIYANKNWLNEKIDTPSLSGYYIWVAHYSETCGYTGTYCMWQYTEKGTVDGIKGNVDLNRSYF